MYHLHALYANHLHSPPYQSSDFNWSTLIALIGLGFAIWQTYLSRKSVEAADKSIRDSTLTRQLEMLPQMHRVIHVQIHLDRWVEDLQKRKGQIYSALQNKDMDLLKEASSTTIKQPKDLHLRKIFQEGMPAWLEQIWCSGAQYYYNAIVCAPYILEEDGKPKWEYAKIFADERLSDSIDALEILRAYIKDMIPNVVLQTPASVNDGEFFVE